MNNHGCPTVLYRGLYAVFIYFQIIFTFFIEIVCRIKIKLYICIRLITIKKYNDMKSNYQNFVNRLMKSTGLTIDQMQTFEEWIENRNAQFQNEADEKELKSGFQNWLNERY